jgi:hypothetical protein
MIEVPDSVDVQKEPTGKWYKSGSSNTLVILDGGILAVLAGTGTILPPDYCFHLRTIFQSFPAASGPYAFTWVEIDVSYLDTICKQVVVVVHYQLV